MAGEIRPVDIDRRRGDGAVGRRRKVVAVAGERSAQIGDQRVALPVGDREKFRRDHIERRSLRHEGAAGIGVVAAAQFERGLDQKAAGVIADRAERIVVDLQPLARRLADHRAGHRRRDRRLVGGSPTAGSTAAPGRCRASATRRPAAGARRRLRLGLARIEFWLLAGAVERVVAGGGGAAGGGKAVGRDLADPRRRRHVLVAQPRVVGGIAGLDRWLLAVRRSGKSCGETKPSRDGRNRSGVRVWAWRGGGRIEGDQRKAWQKRA